MSQVISAAVPEVASDDLAVAEVRPAIVLKGTGRGLEITIAPGATAKTIGADLTALLSEAPSFFAGNQARVVTDGGPLPPGALARIERVATRFDLRIVEIGARKQPAQPQSPPQARFADGSGAIAPAQPAQPARLDGPSFGDLLAMLEMPAIVSQPTEIHELHELHEIELVADEPPPAPPPPPLGPKFVQGPVRSGVILEHGSHIVVIGDVNPGAEVRAEGNIIVLGRLRGVAHAAIGRDAGFIVSLSLQPQQLRVCRKVARAGDNDKNRPGDGCEIAYATGDKIVVERFTGRLPSGLAASI